MAAWRIGMARLKRTLLLPPQAKMDRGEYNNPLEYEYDMMLVWNNCMTYNQVCPFGSGGRKRC